MERTTMERATRLIRAATGEDYGDGYVVTDIITGYAEPGYGTIEDVVVLGNWNDKRSRYAAEKEGKPLTLAERLPSRLGNALERIGAHVEWSDEWTSCAECYRAMRTQPDSYSWRMYGYFHDDACEYVCADCLREDVPSALEQYVNETSRCVTFLNAADMTREGWQQYNGKYENGWHEGMTDNPDAIFQDIRKWHPDADVVFLLDENSQFYITFSAWIRETEEDVDED